MPKNKGKVRPRILAQSQHERQKHLANSCLRVVKIDVVERTRMTTRSAN